MPIAEQSMSTVCECRSSSGIGVGGDDERSSSVVVVGATRCCEFTCQGVFLPERAELPGTPLLQVLSYRIRAMLMLVD